MADNNKITSSAQREQAGEPEEKTATPKKRHVFDSGCPHCGALLPAGKDTCLVCGEKCGDIPYEGAFPVVADGRARPAPVAPDRAEIAAARQTPNRWRRWLGGLSCLVVLVVAVLGGISVYQQYFDTGSFRAADAVVYQAGDGVLMLSHPGLDEPLAVSGAIPAGADFGGGAVVASPNGRWMACTDGAGFLYRIDLAQGGADALLVSDSYAQGATFSLNSDYLLYITGSGELYASDLSDKWRLDTGVVEILATDGRKVLYTRRGDSDGQNDLYLNDLRQSGGEWWLIDRGIGGVLDWADGFEKILYTTLQTDEDGEQTANLHQFEIGETGKSTTTTLVSSIGEVLDASAAHGRVVYFKPQPQRWSYEHFIDDDMAAQDAAMREPDLAEYPLVEEAFARYGEGAEIVGITDNEDLVEQLATWREAEQAWQDKQNRDNLRARLRQAFAQLTEPIVLGDLYVYQGNTLSQLDSGVWSDGDLLPEQGRVSAVENYIAYEKIHADTLTKLKMSAMWEEEADAIPDPARYFLEGTRRELLFSRLDGEPVRLYLRAAGSTFKQWRTVMQGGGVYFIAGPEDAVSSSGDSLFYSIPGSGMADPVQVERGATEILAPLQDGVLFTAQAGADTRLYFAQGGTSRELAGGDAEVLPVGGGTTLLYIDRRDAVGGTGDLYMFTKEQTLVAGAVADILYRSDELIYLLRPGQESDAWDLYAWYNGRESLVGRDVKPLSGP